MASTLIHIKSKMLLPEECTEEESLEEYEDPRLELVQRLLEYEKFKKASEVLNKRPLLRRDLWVRGRRDIYVKKQEGELIVDESGLTGLLKSYLHAVRRVKKKVYQVFTDLQTIGERILELSPVFKSGKTAKFS